MTREEWKEKQEEDGGATGYISAEHHVRAIMQGLWGSQRHKAPLVKMSILSLWSDNDATILQAFQGEWLTETFLGFYEKTPERHVNHTFIKDHLGSLYDA